MGGDTYILDRRPARFAGGRTCSFSSQICSFYCIGQCMQDRLHIKAGQPGLVGEEVEPYRPHDHPSCFRQASSLRPCKSRGKLPSLDGRFCPMAASREQKAAMASRQTNRVVYSRKKITTCVDVCRFNVPKGCLPRCQGIGLTVDKWKKILSPRGLVFGRCS